MSKIAVEGENITCVQLAGHLNQAGVRKIRRGIAILLHQCLNVPNGFAQAETNFQDA